MCMSVCLTAYEYIYSIYSIYMCVCVCVCLCVSQSKPQLALAHNDALMGSRKAEGH